MKYIPGNPFSDRVSVADAAVMWAGLNEEQQEYVSITENGWPEMGVDRTLRQRAEALYEALSSRQLKGMSTNEDGYPLPLRLCYIERASLEDWLRKRKGADTMSAAQAEADEELLDVAAVAEIMGYSPKTLKRRREEGLFPKEDFDTPLRWKRSTAENAKRAEEARKAALKSAKARIDDI